MLKELANKKAWTDDEDVNIDDYAGGNIDDAYYGGERAGKINLAREILDALDINYEEKIKSDELEKEKE